MRFAWLPLALVVLLTACHAPPADRPPSGLQVTGVLLSTQDGVREVVATIDDVDRAPAPVGGVMAMMRGMMYPEDARRLRRQGAVTVSFVVDETGEVHEARVVRGLGAGLDHEALRLVRAAQFEPGLYEGAPTAMRVTLPIRFRLR